MSNFVVTHFQRKIFYYYLGSILQCGKEYGFDMFIIILSNSEHLVINLEIISLSVISITLQFNAVSVISETIFSNFDSAVNKFVSLIIAISNSEVLFNFSYLASKNMYLLIKKLYSSTKMQLGSSFGRISLNIISTFSFVACFKSLISSDSSLVYLSR